MIQAIENKWSMKILQPPWHWYTIRYILGIYHSTLKNTLLYLCWPSICIFITIRFTHITKQSTVIGIT